MILFQLTPSKSGLEHPVEWWAEEHSGQMGVGLIHSPSQMVGPPLGLGLTLNITHFFWKGCGPVMHHNALLRELAQQTAQETTGRRQKTELGNSGLVAAATT